MLVFGGTRTYHRMAAGLEDAGFEIRDCLTWMYGQGFPKSLDVSKAIDKAAGVAGSVRRPEVSSARGLDRPRRNARHGRPRGYQRPWMQDEDAVDRAARRYVPGSRKLRGGRDGVRR